MKYGSLFAPFTGKETITNAQKIIYLQSPAYCKMIRKMVVGITGNHKLSVRILPPNHPELGYTNGKLININTLHPLFRTEPIDDITTYCLALTTHESLHPLYSCFQCIEDAARKRPKESDNLVYVRRSIFNILEDARIERIGRYKFPGVAYAIDQLNEFLYSKVNIKEDMKEIEIFMQWLLDFSSVYKVRGEIADNLKDVWKKVIPLAKKARDSDTCNKCYYYTKKIVNLIAPFVPEDEEIDNRQQKPDNTEGSLSDVNANTKGNSTSNSTTSSDQDSNSKNNGNSTSDTSDKDTLQKNNKADTELSDDKSTDNGNSQNNQNTAQGGDDSSGGLLKTPEAENQAAKDLKDMIESSLNSSFKEYNEDAKANEHDKKKAEKLRFQGEKTVKIIPYFGDYSKWDTYEIIRSSVVPVINNLKKGLKNILNYNVDEVSRYLHGGKIDGKSLSRIPSGAICAKRIEKNEEAELSISVLVDMSGSMDNRPITYAKAACTVLLEVCNDLNIPICVMGFQSGLYTNIYYFADSSMKGRYAHTGIVSMNANGGTPLNAGLKHLFTQLKSFSNPDRLVIVITDGEPNEPIEVCKQTVKKLSNEAEVYGLAIGDGRKALSAIFGSNYIEIDSLDKLPKELCRIIERNLFKR